ncbi:MAG TPA: toxin TcdB middle/N-terminal domain-containing protein [Polyangia bacterium]
MRYVDLMSGIKPHLLTSVKNNLGATTTVTYLPSTKFYLDDRNAGLPWVTRLPFPVHVVASVETDEAVTGTRLVTTYRYHHGHYDGIEREFAGFGMVEQEDAETLRQGAAAPFAYTPPKRVKTWFDTGAFFESGPVSTQYRREYSSDFPQLVPDSTGPAGITPDEAREAARARRGRIVRQELFGLDGSALEPHPYIVTESNCEVRRIQPRDGNRYAAFDVIPRETLTAHSERNPADPRSEHDVTLAVDAFGNVLEAAHVAYARNGVGGAVPQARTLVTYKQADYVTLAGGADYYRAGLVRESRTYELTGLPQPAASGVYSRAELAALVAQINGSPSAEVDFSATTPPATPARRLFERTRRVFVGDQPADDQLLALGLVVDTQRAGLTPTLVDDIYQSLVVDPNARNQLLSDNKYIGDPGLWWAPTGQTLHVPALFYQAQQFTDPFGNVSTVGYDTYALLLSSATSAVGTPYATTATVQSDYRVLAPSLITDANGNRAQAELDALGRVTKAWVMGKTTETVGDDAGHPSTRIEYHPETVPPYVYVEKREEHWHTDPTNANLQRAYTYSDGLGREVLTKKQAQPDASGAARWTGTGRTVFDNKGNPVQKFEPYFSATPGYETVINGVSDLLHYDPLDRVVRVDHPNGSYSRFEFGELVQNGMGWTHQLNAWGQLSYDENDTVAEPNNAWYGKYSAGTPDEQDAAGKTLAQNKIATPTRLHIDPLGRTYLTEQDNGFDAAGNPSVFATTLDLDIQGNQRTVIDARGVTVATSTFDMLGRKLVVDSVDAGTKTVLLDAAGAVVHEWNPNAIEIVRQYDPVRRRRRVWVSESGGPQRLAERTFYGETLADAATHNLYGRVYCQLDGAGLIRNADYDFKGNLLSTSRQLASGYDQKADWTDVADPTSTTASLGVSGLDAESFATTTTYDALNRIARAEVPSGMPNVNHVVLPGYNETGLLGSMGVQLDGAATATPFVTRIDYNEKEQRLAIAYGNGVSTAYSYEPDTFRLSAITTTKTTKGDLQALAYTYDPVGNITTIEDSAQQTLFVGNSKISPRTRYTYDAIYRLIYALGREHTGQALPDQTSTPDGVPIPSPTDPQAMRLYAETYQYDAVGNFLAMIHAVTNAQGQFQNLWTRTYTPDAHSNRLLSTVTGDGTTSTPTTYSHDLAGNITAMSPAPLPTIDWDYRDQLVHAVSSRGDTYCSYDSGGQRVRKVLVPPSGPVKERIYLGAYEIYREHTGGLGAGSVGPTTLERRTLHVTDDRRRIALIELLTVGTPSTPRNVNSGPAQLIRYQLDNHLGSEALELDGIAKLLSYEEYHPYGTTAYRATDGALAMSPKRYAFIAKERDDETGLYYCGLRYYAPWLGRWSGPDPAGMVDGPALYSYCRDNPIRLRDPNGMKDEETFKPSVAEGLMAYGISQQTFAFETAGRVQRTTLPALAAERDAEAWKTDPHSPMSMGPAKDSAWDSVKRFWRGLWGPSDGPPAPTRPSILKTPYSIELVEVPNERLEEKYAHYIAASPSKTPAATRAGAATGKALNVALGVVSLAYAPAALGRLAGATTDPAAFSLLGGRQLTLNSSNLAMGVEKASPELLGAIQRHGRTIHIAVEGSEEMRYLDWIGAEANVGGPNMTHILLRPDPSKAAVLEEFLHGTQWRLGIVERLGMSGAETQVKDFMIRHSRLLGLGAEDVEALRKLKEAGL